MRRGAALAVYWFFYFGGLGIFFPYYSLYLRENAGLTGTEVGIVVAALPLVGLVAQPLWGHVADRTGARTPILVLLTVGAAAGYGALGLVSGFAAMLASTALLAFFATAVLPVSVSVTLAALGDRGPRLFGLVRVWGTLGYLVFVIGFPWLLGRFQARHGLAATGAVSEPGLELMFFVTAALVFAAALVGPFLPRDQAVGLRAAPGEGVELLRHGAVRRLLLFSLASYVFLQGPMTLFPIYVRALGGDIDTVGRMWVLMLLVEIPLVAFMGAGLERVGPRVLLALGVLAGGLRWVICGLTWDTRVIYPIQLVHGVVVAGLMIGAPLYLETVVPPHLRSTGQALLATFGTGLGGILSNAGAGWLLERVGPNAPYLVGGAGAIVLGLLVGRILPETRRVIPPPPPDPP